MRKNESENGNFNLSKAPQVTKTKIEGAQNLIQKQPLPWQNFKEPPKVLYLWERKIMAKDMLVSAKT